MLEYAETNRLLIQQTNTYTISIYCYNDGEFDMLIY